jgi:SAM-dependent methyltransferase
MRSFPDWQRVVRECLGTAWKHPQRRYEETITAMVSPGDVVVDLGCGRDMPLRGVLPTSVRYVGVDRVGGVRADLENLPLADRCADLAVSKSVLEHLEAPEKFFAEVCRVLKPGRALVVLTPNFWDPASLAAWIIPNRWHGPIVRYAEGRDERDTFPTFYRANTPQTLCRLCRRHGLLPERIEIWNQYPSILHRWPILLRIGCRWAQFLDRVEPLRWLGGWIFLIAWRVAAPRSRDASG